MYRDQARLFIILALSALAFSILSTPGEAFRINIPLLKKLWMVLLVISSGLAIYTTYAMVGFLGGPVLIGFLAQAFSLPLAFMAVVGAGLFWVLAVRWVK